MSNPDVFRTLVLSGESSEEPQARLTAQAIEALGSGVKLTLLEWLELAPDSRLAFMRAHEAVSASERRLLAHEIAMELARTVLAATR